MSTFRAHRPALREASHRVERVEATDDTAAARSLIAGVCEEFKAAPSRIPIELPERQSARGPLALWQILALGLMITLLPSAMITFGPFLPLSVAGAVLGPVFFRVLVVRVAALVSLLRPESSLALAPAPTTDLYADWPTYTIIVPLYREAAVVRELVTALCALDYPADRLQVLFALETDDAETAVAVASATPPTNFATLVVPPGHPRTKPRALMHALAAATGEFVVVYDAEDLPEPDQLKKAVVAFYTGGDRLGCVQARLNIYNPQQSWLTRQFTLEYTALFDAILPALASLSLPIPLGGTSNHFPRAVLQQVGGWDPYNVTEDADLGIRLARQGYRIGILSSTTWEEAPPKLSIWMGQRVRWLKGWMQTTLVHTRDMAETCRDLGTWAFLGLLVLLGGMIASALVHPWAYALLAWNAAAGHGLFMPPDGRLPSALWMFSLVNLLAAYVIGAILAVTAAHRRGIGDLTLVALTVPVYWLLISAAAYRAAAELIAAPYRWRKTEHTPGRTIPESHRLT